MNRAKIAAPGCLGLRMLLLWCIALPSVVLASDKQYPIEGSVTAVGISEVDPGGGGGPESRNLHRTYTVRTPNRIFVLECPYWLNGFHIHAPSECGGSKRIEIGDMLHFRVETWHAYLQTDKGKEQELAVLSERINRETADAGNDKTTH